MHEASEVLENVFWASETTGSPLHSPRLVGVDRREVRSCGNCCRGVLMLGWVLGSGRAGLGHTFRVTKVFEVGEKVLSRRCVLVGDCTYIGEYL